MCSKNNNARIDGEPHNGFRFAMTASPVNGLNQMTKRQRLLANDFHDIHLSFA
jgi:hypothetical protein